MQTCLSFSDKWKVCVSDVLEGILFIVKHCSCHEELLIHGHHDNMSHFAEVEVENVFED